MGWLSILEGARSVVIWHWGPIADTMKDFTCRQTGHSGKEYICSITGWEGKGTPQLDEYTAFAEEIRRYGKLIRAMTKEYGAKDNSGVLGRQPTLPPVDISDEDIRWRSFRIAGYTGRVLAIVNTRVGQWCDGRSPRFVSSADAYRIDDRGNLIDYIPYEQPREVKIRILASGAECADLAQGVPLSEGTDGSVSVQVMPGSGRFVFLCPKNSGETSRLKKQYGL